MSISDVVAALMFLGVVAYAIFGGADFGSGVWDLIAGNAKQGAHLRAQIDRSIGPVWEANHVWLIYVLVFLWTAFPEAFAAIMNTLFVPWMFVGLGIVLRGGAFAFRKFSSTLIEARLHGAVFATSSLITPFFLGMIAGAIASGRVPIDGTGDLWASWTGPTSWVGGVLAVLTCTFLAGTFLAADAERSGNTDLAEQIGRDALFAGVITGAGRGGHPRSRRRITRQRPARARTHVNHHLCNCRLVQPRSTSPAALGTGPYRCSRRRCRHRDWLGCRTIPGPSRR
jgi:cytochrome d ubiquinol oxidase subunit II